MGFDWAIILWAVFIIIVGGISFWLALQSMKGYVELPKANLIYNLYLVRTPEKFTQDTLSKIYNLSLQKQSQISLERLIRGNDKVLILFMPEGLAEDFPELSLLPIEDYLSMFNESSNKPNQVSLGQSYVWSIENSKNHFDIKPEFLDSANFSSDELFSLQVVVFPEKGKNNVFQVTLRGLVSYPEAYKRVELVKQVQKLISQNSSLKKLDKSINSGILFENFFKRTFVPREVSKAQISSDQLYNLLRAA